MMVSDPVKGIEVCIPWRAQPDRVPAFNRVRKFWESNGFKVITGDSKRGEPFSLTTARNNAVRKAKGDVIVVADADTIPDLGAVAQAINEEMIPGRVVWPFTEYRHLPGDAVDENDLFSIPPEKVYHNSVGGLFILRRETYWKFGGQDERFNPVWGWEDNAFHAVADTLGDVQRYSSTVYSFQHSADRDMSRDNPNRARWELYRMCYGKPDMMRELIK